MIYRLEDSGENDAKACKHLLLESSYQVIEKATLLNYCEKISTFRRFEQLLTRTKGEAFHANNGLKSVRKIVTRELSIGFHKRLYE